MAKYLIRASYKTKGTKGLIKEGGSARRAAVKDAVEAAGGKLDAFYFCWGDTDAIVIADVPDTITGIALSLAVNSSSAVATSTIPLITPEEVDAAVKKMPSYRAPGEEPPARSSAKKKR